MLDIEDEEQEQEKREVNQSAEEEDSEKKADDKEEDKEVELNHFDSVANEDELEHWHIADAGECEHLRTIDDNDDLAGHDVGENLFVNELCVDPSEQNKHPPSYCLNMEDPPVLRPS